MSLDIKKNNLHYYVDLLRMDGKQRDFEQSETCVTALQNVIQTMKLSRHNKICGEDFTRLNFGNIPLNGIYFSMDGKYPCRFDSCKLNEWNFMSGHSDSITSVAWSPNGKQFLTGSSDGSAILWDTEHKLMIRKFYIEREPVIGVAITSKGRFCLTQSSNDDSTYTIKIWDFDTGEYLRILDKQYNIVKSTIITPDGRFFITNSLGEARKVYNFETGEYLRSLKKYSNYNRSQIFSVKMFYDGKYYFTGMKDSTIEICDLETEKRLCFFYRDFWGGSVFADGNYCIICSIDGTAKVWNIETGECLKILQEKFLVPSTLAFSPDRRKCLIGTYNHSAEIWEMETGERKYVSDGFFNKCCSASLSPNKQYCLMRFNDGTIKLFDCKIEKSLQSFKVINILYGELSAISSDGKCCAILCKLKKDSDILLTEGDTIELWDCKTGMCNCSLKPKFDRIQFIDFSTDGNYVIITSEDGFKEIWNRETGKYLQTIPAYQELPDPIIICRHTVKVKNHKNICEVYLLDNISEPILSFYNVNDLHIENCLFRNITADKTTHKILYQYGGDIEKPEQ